MDSSDDSALLFQVCFLIESGNLQGLREYLEKHTNIETVSLPFPALIFDNRQLVPAIHAAVKASTHQISSDMPTEKPLPQSCYYIVFGTFFGFHSSWLPLLTYFLPHLTDYRKPCHGKAIVRL